MIYDKRAFVLLEAILFLWMITFLMTLIISLVQAYPKEDTIYRGMLEDAQVEALYDE